MQDNAQKDTITGSSKDNNSAELSELELRLIASFREANNDKSTFKSETLTTLEIRLIENLREEAESVKDCYTRFSFQSWIFTVAALSLIFKFQTELPIIGVLALLPIILLLAVGRVGIHKYSTANRLYGFELYMNRRKRMSNSEDHESKRHRSVGWEEAYYAWRIVQASIFETIYETGRGSAWYKKIRPIKPASENFQRCSLFRTEWNDALLYTGSYLKVNFLMMFAFCLMSLCPLYYLVFQLYAKNSPSNIIDFLLTWEGFGTVGLAIGTSLFVVYRSLRLTARRRILETGLLSINACAFCWNVVIHAHFRAIDELSDDGGPRTRFRGYTGHLFQQADDIAKRLKAQNTAEYSPKADAFDTLYDWMDGGLVEDTTRA